MTFTCTGNGNDHCCYVSGRPCVHLEEGTVSGRRWVCGLMRELGTWDEVHSDSRYLVEPKPVWEKVGAKDCGDFIPVLGKCCS